MSLVDGSDFVVYHGELRRRSRRAPGLRPAVAYQVTAMAWAAISNGMVASTARAVRLRAWPAPKSCFESSIDTSMDQRLAYRSMTCAIVAAVSVVTRAMPKPRPGLSLTQDHGDGTGAEHGVPQAPDQGGFDGLGLAVAGDRDLREFRSSCQSRQGREALSLHAGPSGPAGPLRGRPCRAASLRSRVVQEIPAGRPFSSPPA
jgi:hypothetical protein